MKRRVYRSLDRPATFFGIRGRFLWVAAIGGAMALVVGLVVGGATSMILGFGAGILAGVGAYLMTLSLQSRIDEKDLPHLFERFYKADASHHGGGTGLGLAIVREVLVQLGEKIWAENDGNETVFRFTLDRTEPPS